MGFSEKQYWAEIREFYFKVMIKPTIFLFSLLIAGSIIDVMIGSQNTARTIFAGIGGIGYLIEYYKQALGDKKN